MHRAFAVSAVPEPSPLRNFHVGSGAKDVVAALFQGAAEAHTEGCLAEATLPLIETDYKTPGSLPREVAGQSNARKDDP